VRPSNRVLTLARYGEVNTNGFQRRNRFSAGHELIVGIYQQRKIGRPLAFPYKAPIAR